MGDASPSTEDASPVTSSKVQSNPVGLTGAYFRGPASPPSSARPHNHAPVHTSVHNDRPSTLPIPRGCLLTPCGSGPVVSLHARARRPSRLARGLSTNTRTARTRATGTHLRQHLRDRTLSRTRTRTRLRTATCTARAIARTRPRTHSPSLPFVTGRGASRDPIPGVPQTRPRADQTPKLPSTTRTKKHLEYGPSSELLLCRGLASNRDRLDSS